MRQFLAAGAALLFVLSGLAAPALAASPADAAAAGSPAAIDDSAAGPPAALAGPAAESPIALQRDGALAECASPSPANHADPSDDVLGWSAGYWYDEPIAVDDSDGLNETELDALVARTQARVEAIRCLQFESETDIEIVTRAEFRNETQQWNVTEAERRFENAVYGGLMLVGDDADAVEVQRENLGAGVGGYYEPATDRLVVVSDDPDAVRFSEPVLAHELVHALQDQQFDLTQYDARTIDDANAENGLVEGDASYVEHVYRRACGGTWEGTCRTDAGDGPSGGDLANLGMYLLSYQPYSDGPRFVRHLRQSGNWSTVDRAYERVPETSQEVMYPVRYPDETTRNLSAPNRSADGWERLSVAGRPDYEIAGEPGLFTMFAAPSLDENGGASFVRPGEFVQGGQQALDPYDYSAEITDGWNGDRLYPYRNGDGETGHVWQIAWESRADAEEFALAYGNLLRYYDARSVDGRADTYVLDGRFDGAYAVQLDGRVVRIVHAPDVESLQDLHPDVAPDGDSSATVADSSDTIPGFGAALAVAALAVAALLSARRSRRR